MNKVKNQDSESRVPGSVSGKSGWISASGAHLIAIILSTGCSSANFDNEKQIIEIFKEVSAEQAGEQEIRAEQHKIRQPYFHYKRLKIAPPEIG